MLHELLLALVGCTGDVFVDTAAEDGVQAGPGECTFRLSPDYADIVSQSERVVLERLLHLGHHYQKLDQFVRETGDSFWKSAAQCAYGAVHALPDSIGLSSSLYQNAIANAVSEELSDYTAAIVTVEKVILRSPCPLLARVTEALHEFEHVLPPLYMLVCYIQDNNIRGCNILDLLEDRTRSGYKDTATLYLWDRGGSQSAPKELQDTLCQLETDITINNEMKPRCISEATASSIFFVGKAVNILCKPRSLQRQDVAVLLSQNASVDNDDDISMMSKETLRMSLQDNGYSPKHIIDILSELQVSSAFSPMTLEKLVSKAHSIVAEQLWRLILEQADLLVHLKGLKEFYLLSKGDFFQAAIWAQCEDDKIFSNLLIRHYRRPSGRAVFIFTSEADERDAAKFCMSGACYTTTACNAVGCSWLLSRVSGTSATVTSALPGLVIADNESNRGSVREVSFSEPSSAVKVGAQIAEGNYESLASASSTSEATCLDQIHMEYRVMWPLQLLITPLVIARYNRIFRHLLLLKRAQWELERAWALARQTERDEMQWRDPVKQQLAAVRRHERNGFWKIRQYMSFLVSNLQFYIQVDVIEPQYKRLQDRILTTCDYNHLVRFHDEFLSALTSQSFLEIGSIFRIVGATLGLCLQLCKLTRTHKGNPPRGGIQPIMEEFGKKANSLHTILRSTKLAGSTCAPFLRQLLLRLNFNSFLEHRAWVDMEQE
eukprot:SM000116S24207  [mRNA]  locus=s116:56790:62328:- [translate_table: standard]